MIIERFPREGSPENGPNVRPETAESWRGSSRPARAPRRSLPAGLPLVERSHRRRAKVAELSPSSKATALKGIGEAGHSGGNGLAMGALWPGWSLHSYRGGCDNRAARLFLGLFKPAPLYRCCDG